MSRCYVLLSFFAHYYIVILLYQLHLELVKIHPMHDIRHESSLSLLFEKSLNDAEKCFIIR